MLTQEDDVEIHALARRGWSKSGDRPAYRPGPQDGREVPGRSGPGEGAGAELS